MNPLAAYLLSVVKNERTSGTRRYTECEDALREIGYWLLYRPAWCERRDMPTTAIREECRLIEEFRSYTPPSVGLDGFDVIVEVYEDPGVVDRG